MSHHLQITLATISKNDAPHSIALARGEYDDQFVQHCHRLRGPKVFFLDRVRLSFRSAGDGFATADEDHYKSGKRFCHVFRVKKGHPLTAGLPEKVAIYGACPVVTPLEIEDGMDVLVSLNGIAVVAKRGRDVIIGADPWQLGVPSVPMVYKLLSNWLHHELGLKHRIPKPFAIIRLDDLPTTAEELRSRPPSRELDRKRSKTIRRLRKFGKREGTPFTIMYSSHYYARDGNCKAISSVMPRSISEIQLGVKEGVFEIGSHGMVHLRNGTSDPAELDPREFLDLDEQQTTAHLKACADEIYRLFDSRPQSFVAPAWGYRPGVTKRIAAKDYSVIVDSSQHWENGTCGGFLEPEADGNFFNAVETFRSGERMLTYSNPEFWRCYVGAGIPIHYMQHTDSNWDILKWFLRGQVDSRHQSPHGKLRSRLLRLAEESHRPTYLRAACATLLTIVNCSLEPSSWGFLWKVLTRSSMYSFTRAMKASGYKSLTLAEFIQTGLGSASLAAVTTPIHDPVETTSCQ